MSQPSFSFMSMPPLGHQHHHPIPSQAETVGAPLSFNSLGKGASFFSSPTLFGEQKQQPQQLMSSLLSLIHEPQGELMARHILRQGEQQELLHEEGEEEEEESDYLFDSIPIVLKQQQQKPPSPKLLPLIQQAAAASASASSSATAGAHYSFTQYPLSSASSQQQQQQQQHHQQQDSSRKPSPPTLDMSKLKATRQAQSTMYSDCDSKNSSSQEDEANLGSQFPPQQQLPRSGSSSSVSLDEVAVFVQGTWKYCTFNHSQLLREFAVIPRKLIKKLVSMSEKEHWGNNNEVLLSYLNYTFRRLIDEKKVIAYFADGPQHASKNQPVNKVQAPIALCFNSGLLTTGYERIYCFLAPNKNQREIFQQNSHKKFVEWFVTLFVKESDILKQENIIRSKLGVSPIPVELLPHRTSYFSDKDRTPAKELVWNAHTTLESISYCDMIKNMRQNDHLGSLVQSTRDDELTIAIRNGLTVALKRVESNPRIAVPQYYWDKNATLGELQLLLPLDLDYLDIKCAVTVRIAPSGKYEIRTVLSLNQAYTNARLIQKIDQAWLMKGF